MRITGKTFWDFYVESMQKAVNSDIKIFDIYGSSTLWTKEIKNIVEKMCIEKLNMKSSVREFWPRLDLALFDNCCDENWDEWAMEIAIEIENNFDSIRNEIMKLMIINSGLKVVITYIKKVEQIEDLIIDFQKVYKSRKYHTENDNWLFIFGPSWLGSKWDKWYAIFNPQNNSYEKDEKDLFNTNHT